VPVHLATVPSAIGMPGDPASYAQAGPVSHKNRYPTYRTGGA